jgi:hypothetical protein
MLLKLARKAASRLRYKFVDLFGWTNELESSLSIPRPRSSRRLSKSANSYVLNRADKEVKTRVKKYHALRKDRSLQRVLRSAGRKSLAMALEKTKEDLTVGEDLTFGFKNETEFRARLERERAMVTLAAREAAERAQRERREEERAERKWRDEERLKEELEETRVLNQARIRGACAEARRKEEGKAKLAAEEQAKRIAEEKVRRLQEEHNAHLAGERQKRIQAEWIAQLERKRVAQLEEEAQEREEQRIRDEEAARVWCEAELARLDAEIRAAAEEQSRQEAQARAQQEEQRQRDADEYIRQWMDQYIRSTPNPETHEGIHQAFQAQEDHLGMQLEAEAMAPVAVDDQDWLFSQPRQQDQNPPAQDDWSHFMRDVPMADPSLASIPDVSMASVLSDSVPSAVTHPFELYEARWKELRGPNTASTSQLIFASIPWPVFQSVSRLDDLKDTDIGIFFGIKYRWGIYQQELARWQPHEFEQLRSKIHPGCVESVREGFLKCARVIDVVNAYSGEGLIRT